MQALANLHIFLIVNLKNRTKVDIKRNSILIIISFIIITLAAFSLGCKDPNLSAQSSNEQPPNQSTVEIDDTNFTPFPDTGTLPCSNKAIFCVGLVVDSTGINDNAFNQSAWTAVERAKNDLNAKISYKESQNSGEFGKNIKSFAEQGYDVVVTVSSSMRDSTLLVADKYPETHFIGVDQHQFSEVSNVSGLIFSERKAGFLAGVLAGIITETEVVGIISGPENIHENRSYKEGFEYGLRSVRPDTVIYSEFFNSQSSNSSSDLSWGATTAKDMSAKGADIIFVSGSTEGSNALLAISETKNTFCIGANADQWLYIPEARDCIVSSAVKDIETGVFELIAWVALGKAKQGNYLGNVNLAPFHDYEKSLTAEIRIFMKEVNHKIESGEISIFAADQLIENVPTISLRKR
ncbi:MAG: BMP family ABC transporter substrate-binding protein [Chloroflexota bacterium]